MASYDYQRLGEDAAVMRMVAAFANGGELSRSTCTPLRGRRRTSSRRYRTPGHIHRAAAPPRAVPESVVFSDVVVKINRKDRPQVRARVAAAALPGDALPSTPTRCPATISARITAARRRSACCC
jgi:hypothetical protein